LLPNHFQIIATVTQTHTTKNNCVSCLAHTRAYIHTHSNIQTYLHKEAHTDIKTHIHTRSHTHTHTRSHTHTHTHRHTHKHTHTHNDEHLLIGMRPPMNGPPGSPGIMPPPPPIIIGIPCGPAGSPISIGLGGMPMPGGSIPTNGSSTCSRLHGACVCVCARVCVSGRNKVGIFWGEEVVRYSVRRWRNLLDLFRGRYLRFILFLLLQ